MFPNQIERLPSASLATYACAILLTACTTGTQGSGAPPPPAPPAPPAPGTSTPLEPRWEGVELMGVSTDEREAVLAEIDLDVGAPYTQDHEAWRAVERELEERFGFAEVLVSVVRYMNADVYLVVDIVQRGDEARLEYAPAPTGDLPLADAEVLRLHGELRAIEREGFLAGTPPPSKVDGGFLDYEQPELHALALQLRERVPAHRTGLIDVIHGDADARKRAQAATLLHWGGEVADSIACVYPGADDPDVAVRNNVTRFMLHYLALIDDAAVRAAIIEQLALQLTRPSHADRNKAVYGLLRIVEARPEDARAVEAVAGHTLRVIARDSVLFNVRDPARDLLELIAQAEG